MPGDPSDRDAPDGPAMASLPAADVVLRASRGLLGAVIESMSPALELVTLQQFRALVVLSLGGDRPAGVIATRLGIQPSTFTRALDRLEKNGWVTRSRSAISRREVIIGLTPKGSDLVAGVVERRRALIDAALHRIDPAHRDSVVPALTEFARALDTDGEADLLTLGM